MKNRKFPYKTTTFFLSIVSASVTLGALFLPSASIAKPIDNSAADLIRHKALFSPLPEVSPPADEKQEALIALGEKLYLDPILSLGEDISCNSCHLLNKYGVDNEPTSPGHQGQRGDRNSPTSYNAFLHISQFWDGRAKDVEEQALGPVLNPVEMAMPSEAVVVERLKKSEEYIKLFEKAFAGEAEPMTYKNMGRAIGAFERTLVTPGRFDDYLKGKVEALTSAEVQGLNTFVEVGCTACHMGPVLGGQMYQKIGLVRPYETKDLGRYNVTKSEADKHFFKVPALRNIAETAPYFHDGSVKTLEEAIQLMGRHQLGRELTSDQVHDIALFLKSLTGKLPERFANAK